MRVLQVTPRYFPNLGGVETVVKRISELLVERGLPVIVYSFDRRSKMMKRQNINGVLVKRFKPLVGDPLYLPPPSFFKAIKREKADIVHVHNAHTLIPAFIALSKRRRQKLLLQPHYHKTGQTPARNMLLSLYKFPLRKVVFPRVEFVIVNSSYEKRIVRSDFPHYKEIVLIQEGISLVELKSVKWNPQEPTRLLYVGALRRYKNVESILEAFTYIIKKRERSFKLVVVGDGPEREYLMNLARENGVEEYVEWKHNLSRKQLLTEYAKAGVFISLSQLESFSRVVHEAILIGVPTVVQNFGATADVVRKGLAEGVNSLNPSVVADAILKASKRHPEEAGRTQNAFLSWEEYLDRIMEIYRKALEHKR